MTSACSVVLSPSHVIHTAKLLKAKMHYLRCLHCADFIQPKGALHIWFGEHQMLCERVNYVYIDFEKYIYVIDFT